MNIKIILILIIILLVLIIIFLPTCGSSEYFTSVSPLPKTIWTYWDGEKSKCVEYCIESWKKFNPDYEIIILNPTILPNYLPEVDIYGLKHATTHQRTSDFIRLAILYKFGGFWIDASMLMTTSLQWLQDYQLNGNYDLIAYHKEANTTNSQFPVIDSWFFACNKHSSFINEWMKTFFNMNNFDTVDEYLKDMSNQKIDFQNIGNVNYLAIHCAAQYVLQKLMTSEEIKKKLLILRAEDGPFKYLYLNKWNSYESVRALCNDKNTITPMIKFTRHERKHIDKNENGQFDCIFTLT